MQIDALTLAAVADELRDEISGARMDDVIQPTPHAVALQCYGGGRNRWLLASAHPQFARVHLVDQKPRKLTAEPPAFVMLLRKYVEGARVREIRQPRWERMVEIAFARGASGEAVWLIIEVMGQLSNVILRDDAGVILGALRHVSAEQNRYRTIAPHVPYRYPPPQTRTLRGETLPRLDPASVTGTELAEGAEEVRERGIVGTGKRRAKPTAATVLTEQVAGWSRDLAAEALARAGVALDVGPAPDVPWEALAAEVRDLAGIAERHAWEPTLVFATDGATLHDAAVYRPQRFADAVLRSAPSVNTALATYFEGVEWRSAVESAKSGLRHLLQTQRDRCRRKAEALRDELAALDEAARLRLEADTLLAFQADVPAHASSFTVANPFASGGDGEDAPTLTIALDPQLSAVENANRLYARYHKLQRAGERIPPQIEANEVELARVEQLATDLDLAETPQEIAQVRAEVAEAGYLRGERAEQQRRARKGGTQGKHGKGGKGSKSGQQPRRAEGGVPLRRQSAEGFVILVGKNSRQNEEVTFHEASGGDMWLHARGVPGAHVIVKAGGRPVGEATLREAAALAAYYSQARQAGSVPVDYTQQRYVRHMKDGGPGMVVYERERTLHVAPADAPAG